MVGSFIAALGLVAAEHSAQLEHIVADYTIVMVPGYTTIVPSFVAEEETMVVQGQTAMEVVVYMAPMLLVVLLAAVLSLSGGSHLSQSMNRTSFPRANHKNDSFCCHVQLTEKMYSTNFLPW